MLFTWLFYISPSCSQGCTFLFGQTTRQQRHISKRGGSRSSLPHKESIKILRWAESHVASIKVEHVKVSTNLQADWLNRRTLQEAERSLNRRAFQLICNHFGTPVVDLFASLENAQLQRFYTRFYHHLAEDTDSVVAPWPKRSICLPTTSGSAQVNQKNSRVQGRDSGGSTILAQETVVFSSAGDVNCSSSNASGV